MTQYMVTYELLMSVNLNVMFAKDGASYSVIQVSLSKPIGVRNHAQGSVSIHCWLRTSVCISLLCAVIGFLWQVLSMYIDC